MKHTQHEYEENGKKSVDPAHAPIPETAQDAHDEKASGRKRDSRPLWQKDPEHYRKRPNLFVRILRKLGAFFAFCLLTGGVLCVLVLGALVTLVYSYSNPELDERFANLSLSYTSFIYAADAETGAIEVYEELYNTSNRVWTSIDDMPQHLLDAVVAVEDKRFYQHNGVDIVRTGYAGILYAYDKLIGKSGERQQGASTLTQQLIKNLTGDDEYGLERKVKEILNAFYIERKYNKDQILEYYLNAVNFGNNMNGIAAAARYYFDKEPRDLTVVESAAIVGITKSPTYYEPFRYPEANKERRNTVLFYMYDQGYITSEAEYQQYLNAELTLRDRSVETKSDKIMSWFSDIVFNDVARDLQEQLGYSQAEAVNLIYNGGLKIYATVNPDVQHLMEAYFADESHYPEVAEGEPKQEVAMVVIDPTTGNMIGAIGGRGEKEGSRILNRVTDTVRQPGSSIKPLTVYGQAIEQNLITLGSAIDDSPAAINTVNVMSQEDPKQQSILIDPATLDEVPASAMKPWPSNYDSTYHGLIDIKTALSNSYNTPAVKVLRMVGVEESWNFARNMLGLKNLVEADMQEAPLSVGSLTYGVTVLEMTAAYTVFANNGTYTAPRSYTRVETHDGRVLLENSVDRQIVFTPQTSYLITDILMRAAEVGSSAESNLDPIATAGKSGTTSGFNDRWFIGYTPYYLGGIWWGYDLQNINDNTAHIGMWHDIMQQIHELQGITEASFTQPDGIVKSSYCSVSGKLPTALCYDDPLGSRVKSGYFKSGTEPTESCDVHHELWVCTASGQIAHNNCPAATKKVFRDIFRTYVYDGVTTNDAEYVCPRLTAGQILFGDQRWPVYMYMVPEGEYPATSNKNKKVYRNTLCSTHAQSAVPRYYSGYSFGQTTEYVDPLSLPVIATENVTVGVEKPIDWVSKDEIYSLLEGLNIDYSMGITEAELALLIEELKSYLDVTGISESMQGILTTALVRTEETDTEDLYPNLDIWESIGIGE